MDIARCHYVLSSAQQSFYKCSERTTCKCTSTTQNNKKYSLMIPVEKQTNIH